MKERIEQYIVYLKEDLKLAEICGNTRKQVLALIHDEHYFSAPVRTLFSDTTEQSIVHSEPAQISALKKFLNSLYHAEQALRTVEQLNISRDRYTVGIIKDGAQVSYKAINNVYDALNIIDQHHEDLGYIIGPYIQTLLRASSLANQALSQLTPEHADESQALESQVLTETPTKTVSLLDNIHHIDQWITLYITKLEQAMSKEPTPSTTEAKAQYLNAAVDALTKQFQQTRPPTSAPGFTHCITIMNSIAQRSVHLLTLERRDAMIDALHELKEQLIPQLIDKVEQIEEHLGINPGLLTAPLMPELERYYQQLCHRTLGLNSDSTEESETDTLQDAAFNDARKKNQLTRLVELELRTNNELAITAAETFFRRLSDYIDNHSYAKSLANIEAHEKKILISRYQQFQSYFAALYPELDTLIVSAWNQTTQDSSWTVMRNGNQLQLIRQCQQAVLDSMQHHQELMKFKAQLVRNTISHSNTDLSSTEQQRDTIKAVLLEQEKERPKQTQLTTQEQSTPKRTTLFATLSALNLSATVNTFYQQTLNEYLKTHLSEVIWTQLSKNGALIALKQLPLTQLYQDSTEVAFYKQILNSVYYLQTGLKQLESLKNTTPSSWTITRARALKSTYDVLVKQVMYGQENLVHAVNSPGLEPLAQQVQELLAPMKQIYLFELQRPKVSPKKSTPEQQDMIALWRAQQRIFLSAVTPKAQSTEAIAITPTEATTAIPEFAILIEQKLKNIQKTLYPSATTITAVATLTKIILDIEPNPITSQKVLDCLSRLHEQLSTDIEHGTEHLSAARSELKTLLLLGADDIERHLGLKPTSYSNTYEIHFSTAYDALMSHGPSVGHDEESVSLLDTQETEQRLKHERQHQEFLALEDTLAEDAERLLFGTDYDQFTQNIQYYRELKELVSQLNNPKTAHGSLRTKAEILYEQLQPTLVTIDPAFTISLLEESQHITEVADHLSTILTIYRSTFQPTNALGKLWLLNLETDFQNEEAQLDFLRYYQQLQPYLLQINPQYDAHYFLRKLENPAAFSTAAQEIIKHIDALKELIQGLHHTKAIKLQLAQERVTHFETLLAQQQTLNPQIIEAHKTNIINELLEEIWAQELSEQFGTELAQQLKNRIQSKLEQSKEIVLGDLEVTQQTKALIKVRLTQEILKLIEEQSHSLKQSYYDAIKGQFIQAPSALGVYTDWFLEYVQAAFEAEKEPLVQQIPLDKEFNTKLHEGITSCTQRMSAEHKELKKVCIQLNTLLQTIKKQSTDLTLQADIKEQLQGLSTRITTFKPSFNTALSELQELKDSVVASLAAIRESMHPQVQDKTPVLIQIHELGADTVNPEPKKKVEISTEIRQEENKSEQQEEALNSEQQKELDETLSSHSVDTVINEPSTPTFTQKTLPEKDKVFLDYLQKELSQQLTIEFGTTYACIMISRFTTDLIAQKESLIQDVEAQTIQRDIHEIIQRQLPSLRTQHNELQTLCIALKALYQQVTQSIPDQNDNTDDNACLTEKRTQLLALLDDLTDVNKNSLAEELSAKKAHVEQVLKNNCPLYDRLISLYAHLNKMKQYVEHSDKSSAAIKKAKTDEISSMQWMLTDDTVELEQRLANIKGRGLSLESKKILSKNSDNIFMWLINKLIELIKGPSPEQNERRFFRKELAKIPEAETDLKPDNENSHNY